LLRTVAPILYGLAAANNAVLFLREDAHARRAATPLLVLSLSVHGAEIFLRGLSKGILPIGNVFESLSAIAFAVALVYLFIEVRHQNPMTGVFVIPIVFLGETVACAFLDPAAPTPEILRSALFGLHTGAAILGYCGFAVAAIYGALFLLLYHELKTRRFSLIYDRLPPLDVLGQMNIGALTVGFIFLSIAIIFGGVWVERIHGEAMLGDPKVLLTLAAWVVFGFGIVAHFLLGWRGPRVIYMSVAGFLVLLTSSVAVNVLGRSFHVFR
jgi:ABC-type uncharacterized transport system permease subunit